MLILILLLQYSFAKYELLVPGEIFNDDLNGKETSSQWYALVPEKESGAKLKKVNIRILPSKEPDHDNISNISSIKGALINIRGQNLKEGRIDFFSIYKFLAIGQSWSFGNGEHIFVAGAFSKEVASNRFNINSMRLVYVHKGKSYVVYHVPDRLHRYFQGNYKLYPQWAGDINGDGLLDFQIVTDEKLHNGQLLVSKKKSGGEVEYIIVKPQNTVGD